MPRNTTGGNKAKRGKNTAPKEFITIAEHDEEQHYAKVQKTLGNRRFEVLSLKDNKIRLAHIRGKMRKREWIAQDDIVIIALRNFEDKKCDITHVYTTDEAHRLSKLNLIDPDNIGQQIEVQEECSFDFDQI